MLPHSSSDSQQSAVVVHSILLVEGDRSAADATRSYLESEQFEVIVAKDGGQAQSMFVMRKPDVVLLEAMLPNETGFEVCERLKATDPRVPVLMVTAIDMEDARNLATRVGADGYILKPFHPPTLVETIRRTAQEVWKRFREEAPDGHEPVRFACRCGKRFKVAALHRGKTLTCPKCGETVTVPRHS